MLAERTFPELERAARRASASSEIADRRRALLVRHRRIPGAITLHNYPRFLQQLDRPDGELLDLAAIDILRTRERGVPRYNEFRRLFHLQPRRDRSRT